LNKKLDKYCLLRQKKSKAAKAYFIFSLARELLSRRMFFWFKEVLSFWLWSVKLANLPGGSLLVGFISSCDAYSFDSAIAGIAVKGRFPWNQAGRIPEHLITFWPAELLPLKTL